MSQCNIALENTGSGTCELKMNEIKRILFVTRNKESGALNSITISNAALLAQWVILFNKKSFAADVLEKVVPTPVCFGFTTEQGDQIMFDENGYSQKLADGDYNISTMFYNLDPQVVKGLKSFEKTTISAYFVDANNRVWGVRNGSSMEPFKIQNIAVSNIAMPGRERVSDVKVTMRLLEPTQTLDMVSATITTGSVLDDTDFPGMIDGTATITSPATTGCVATIATDAGWGSKAITGVLYSEANFYDNAATTVAIPVATGEWTELPSGTYTANKTALLQSGHTYLLKILHNGYDIDAATVTVP